MAIDHECSCNKNPLLPSLCRVIDVKQETPDVQTYTIQTLDGKKPFSPLPGQVRSTVFPSISRTLPPTDS